ncbi:antitoxin MazE7 [Streptomyces sp. H10-C2]|uniref:antitoxin MazE7 n=1 Tax=unclassified Streptomyces TaxID=2593676 RepID=UPI0024BB81DF|nr:MULTISPECIES: antitoxin MazE7 [unclassified Streptomyces]MDJ0342797.1 antitoxin MazE7 [Streptomyces sp. PH10-H1]MDJ0372475.1 antitoxin MazE7 [Streptomyces sp. H10-C2]
MADTSVRMDASTRDRLKQLAAKRGMSLATYLDELSRHAENEELLAHASAAFDEAVQRPGFAAAFDDAFGGLPESGRRGHQAA